MTDPKRIALAAADLVENFTLLSKHKAGLVKIIRQNHQFLGVNNAIAARLAARIYESPACSLASF